MNLLEFACQGQRFALPLERVQRVVPSVMPTPLPGAPAIVLGAINVRGTCVTLVDFSRRAGLPPRAIGAQQSILLVGVDGFPAGFVIDEVLGVTRRDEALAALPAYADDTGLVSAVVRLADGLSVVLDPDRFLLAQEKTQLDAALEGLRPS